MPDADPDDGVSTFNDREAARSGRGHGPTTGNSMTTYERNPSEPAGTTDTKKAARRAPPRCPNTTPHRPKTRPRRSKQDGTGSGHRTSVGRYRDTPWSQRQSPHPPAPPAPRTNRTSRHPAPPAPPAPRTGRTSHRRTRRRRRDRPAGLPGRRALHKLSIDPGGDLDQRATEDRQILRRDTQIETGDSLVEHPTDPALQFQPLSGRPDRAAPTRRDREQLSRQQLSHHHTSRMTVHLGRDGQPGDQPVPVQLSRTQRTDVERDPLLMSSTGLPQHGIKQRPVSRLSPAKDTRIEDRASRHSCSLFTLGGPRG